VVRLDEKGEQEMRELRWALIPSWAKDEKIGYRTINARAETVAPIRVQTTPARTTLVDGLQQELWIITRSVADERPSSFERRADRADTR